MLVARQRLHHPQNRKRIARLSETIAMHWCLGHRGIAAWIVDELPEHCWIVAGQMSTLSGYVHDVYMMFSLTNEPEYWHSTIPSTSDTDRRLPIKPLAIALANVPKRSADFVTPDNWWGRSHGHCRIKSRPFSHVIFATILYSLHCRSPFSHL